MSLLNNLIATIKRQVKRRRVSPPITEAAGLTRQVLDRTKLIVLEVWKSTTSQYTRYQDLVVLEGSSATLDFYGDDLDGGGPHPPLGSTYTLLVDDVPTVTNNAIVGNNSSFTLPLTSITEGWHKLSIDCGSTGETAPVCYVYVKKGASPVPDQTEVPIYTGSYAINHLKTDHFYGMVPKETNPTPKPLVPRECPHFSTTVNRNLLYRENIIPFRDNDVHRVNVNEDGVYSTMNTQSYQWSNFVDKYPRMALLDGERGVGTGQMFSHIRVDRHGGAYAADAWRVLRVLPDGEIITRCGYRHPRPVYRDDTVDLVKTSSRWYGYTDGPQQVMELVGDWSAIPEERHGFHEIWGLAFDEDSLALNESAPTIFNPVNGEDEHPHIAGGPRLFVADSQNNRICLLTFQPDSFSAEPVVTEFITGLSDPWDVVWDQGSLYISERFASRITQYNATTGAFIRTVISGPTDMAEFTQPSSRESPRPALPYVLADLRAETIVWPEGLFIQDGWLYYASSAMQQVKRYNLSSEVVEWVCDPAYGHNTNFFKIALSDGTYGPRGTVFVSSWEQFKFGLPEAYLQDGLSTVWANNANGSSGVASGKGGTYIATEYSSAAGIGLGRLLASSSREGLVQSSLALATDPTITNGQRTLYNTGEDEWYANGYQLIHGHGGWGLYGTELPWGESEAIDFYLTNNGHTNPGA